MAPRITKSLWRYIFNATHRVPVSTDLVGYADHTGTPMVTNINECTVAELVAAGSGGTPAVDIGLRRATLNLNDAQIKALPTTPHTIAIGVTGKVFTVLQAILKKNFLAGAYTGLGGNGSELAFYCGDLEVSVNILDDTGQNSASFTEFFGNNISDVFDMIGPKIVPTGVSNLMSGNLNGHLDPADSGDATPISAPLQLLCTNAGAGNFTGGNAANTLVIEVLYWIA